MKTFMSTVGVPKPLNGFLKLAKRQNKYCIFFRIFKKGMLITVC